jgi:hypothetical protein
MDWYGSSAISNEITFHQAGLSLTISDVADDHFIVSTYDDPKKAYEFVKALAGRHVAAFTMAEEVPA